MNKERLLSLDIFRGFTIILMTIVNNPGSWSSVYPPLLHAEWNGCTPTDLVFPFFIFIMGVAIPFSMTPLSFSKDSFLRVLVRALRIFCLGLTLNFFNSIELFGLEGIPLLVVRVIITLTLCYCLLVGDLSSKMKQYVTFTIFAVLIGLACATETFQSVRIPGVLQRIGIVYFFTSLLYLKTTRNTQIIVAVVVLLGYWGLMTLIPVPGIGSPNLNPGTNFASWLDSILLKGHMYVETKTWDPEGFLSTMPAIASGVIGMLVGQILNTSIAKMDIVKRLIGIGLVMVLIGFVWDFVFPINKSIWTSSYVIFTAGQATVYLAILYYIVEIANFKKWATIFLMWGVNPMLVFFFSGLMPRIFSKIIFPDPNAVGADINIQNYIYKNGIAAFFENPMNASLVGALVYVCIWTFILWLFHRQQRIFKV